LGECQKQVLVGQYRVFASSGFLQGAVKDAMAGGANLALSDFEIFSVHLIPLTLISAGSSKRRAKRGGSAAAPS
jgi:hypothetical protein